MSSLKQLLSAFAMRRLRPPGPPAAGSWEVDLLAGIKETPYIGVCFSILLFILLLPTLVGFLNPDPRKKEEEAEAKLAVQAGYNRAVEKMQQDEFGRLRGRVYADYAGAAPYASSLLAEVLSELGQSVHGNPHSEAGWGESRSAAADAARLLTLRLCGADPERYHCIFTAGATAALKLVGESYAWERGAGSTFLYLRDNHTSVLGIRQLAAAQGAACTAAVQLTRSPPPSQQKQPKGTDTGWVVEPCGGPEAAQSLAAASSAAAEAATAAATAGDAAPLAAEHLFAMPVESNFSGVRYKLGLVEAVQQGRLQYRGAADDEAGDADGSSGGSCSSGGGLRALPAGRWRVLLDAAKACGSAPPDLGAHPADFVVLSYYKVWGYPTGLGALLVRRDALPALRRRYFGGGTVAVALPDQPFHSLRPGVAAWEDGTPSFLDYPALLAGMRFMRRLGGFPAVAAHAGAVAASLARQLSAMRHGGGGDGAPVCVLYGAHHLWGVQQQRQQQQQQESSGKAGGADEVAAPAAWGVVGQGPVVTFNVRRADGTYVGYREVERLASLSGILLRTGCLCNPGACAAALGLSSEDMRSNFEAGHVCWDGHDLMGGRPTGVVRASFGYGSTLGHAAAIAALVRRYFVEEAEEEVEEEEAGAAAAEAAAKQAVSAAATTSVTVGHVSGLWVYPIKSCPGFSPACWPLGPSGLLHDRCWVLVDAGGAPLRHKQHPAMARLRPTVDLRRRLLRVTAAGEDASCCCLEVPLPDADTSTSGGSSSNSTFSIRVCSRTAQVQQSSGGPAVAADEQGSGGSSIGSDAEVAAWFSRVLGVPCRLVQLAPAAAAAAVAALEGMGTGTGGGSGEASTGLIPHSFANDSHLLVVGAASLADLRSKSAGMQGEAPDTFAARFRPNLVVGGTAAYAEDSWRSVRVGAVPVAAGAAAAPPHEALQWPAVAAGGEGAASAPVVADPGGVVELEGVGPCVRCDMVCADPGTGRRAGPEPLLTLAGYRRSRATGRITLGLLMNLVGGGGGGQQQQRQQARQQPDEPVLGASGGGGDGVGVGTPQQLWLGVGAPLWVQG